MPKQPYQQQSKDNSIQQLNLSETAHKNARREPRDESTQR
jgi:hypothetical protein